MTEKAKQHHCPNCTKTGLAILPVRYAVARSDLSDQAPRLQDDFGEGVKDIALLEDVAHYTLRAARQGFLYVFNEVRGEWKGYQVDSNSYLTEIDIGAKSPPPATESDEKQLVCCRQSNPAAARCVMIPDAANAGRIWIGYSTVYWTPRILENHRSETERRKHMRCIDLGAWVSGKGEVSQSHMRTLSDVDALVAEYHGTQVRERAPSEQEIQAHQQESEQQPVMLMNTLEISPVDLSAVFAGSLQLFQSLTEETQQLIDMAEQAGEQWGYPPALLALNDPCGVMMDIAHIANRRVAEFKERPEIARPLAVSLTIRSLRQAVLAAVNERLAEEAPIRERLEMLRRGPAWMEQGDEEEAIASRTRESAAQVNEYDEEARSNKWRPYAAKYRQTDLETWETGFNQDLSELDSVALWPLSNAHATWMQSQQALDYLSSVYDRHDTASGTAYTDNLALCIQDTQGYSPCNRLYTQWLESPRAEKENLLLQGLGYNQEKILDTVKLPSEGGLSANTLKTLPWADMISSYEAATKTISEAGHGALVRLMVAVGGPLASAVNTMVEKGVGPALLMLGMVSKTPILYVEHRGAKSVLFQKLAEEIIRANPRLANVQGLDRGLELRARRLRLQGLDPENGTYRYFAMVDEEVVKGFQHDPARPRSEARRLAEEALLTEESRVLRTAERARKRLPELVSGPVVRGLAGSILQWVALTKLSDDLDKTMAHEARENQWRFGAGSMALVGVLAEMVGEWAEKAAAVGNRLAISFGRIWPIALQLTGKALGLGAGLIMAGWDFIRGTQEAIEGNAWVGGMYVVSGVASFGATVALVSAGYMTGAAAAAATGIGIALILLVVILAIAIEVFKDNKLQDWLERCYFGVLPKKNRYPDWQTEIRELEIAKQG